MVNLVEEIHSLTRLLAFLTEIEILSTFSNITRSHFRRIRNKFDCLSRISFCVFVSLQNQTLLKLVTMLRGKLEIVWM